MAVTIKVADKPTLDAVAADTAYIKEHLPSGGGGLDKISVYVVDFVDDDVTITKGALDTFKRTINA